jgi:hypothetical protein
MSLLNCSLSCLRRVRSTSERNVSGQNTSVTIVTERRVRAIKKIAHHDVVVPLQRSNHALRQLAHTRSKQTRGPRTSNTNGQHQQQPPTAARARCTHALIPLLIGAPPAPSACSRHHESLRPDAAVSAPRHRTPALAGRARLLPNSSRSTTRPSPTQLVMRLGSSPPPRRYHPALLPPPREGSSGWWCQTGRRSSRRWRSCTRWTPGTTWPRTACPRA